MAIKKWITKKEIDQILKSYSVRPNEFEPVGDNEYFFKSNYANGYTISLEQEIQYGSEKTGRILVSHTNGKGRRTYYDIWKRDSSGKLQFVFRNPWNKPCADYEYINDLESQIADLREYGQKIQQQLQQGISCAPQNENDSKINLLESENKRLHNRIQVLEEENQKLINKTKHNARGAGRKVDIQHLETQVSKIQSLLNSGKTAMEIQKIMGISRSSFFRYKKLIKDTNHQRE